MARAGFAGSLVVDANWKGRNLNKGMRDSQKRVQGFGKAVRRITTAVALGAGGFVAGKGLVGLLKLSKKGSEAWSDWLLAWNSLKAAMGKVLAGPAESILKWASGVAIELANWLTQFESFPALLSGIGKKVVEFWDTSKNLLKTWTEIGAVWLLGKMEPKWLMSFYDLTLKIYDLWQKLAVILSQAANAVGLGSAAQAIGINAAGPASGNRQMLYGAQNELAAVNQGATLMPLR